MLLAKQCRAQSGLTALIVVKSIPTTTVKKKKATLLFKRTLTSEKLEDIF